MGGAQCVYSGKCRPPCADAGPCGAQRGARNAACAEETVISRYIFLVNRGTDCYNKNRKNILGGPFPNQIWLNMKNNRSTSQGRAVISFGLLRECSRSPRRETRSCQIRSYSLTPFRGKEAATLLGRSHLIIEMSCEKCKQIFLGDINNLAASNHFP